MDGFHGVVIANASEIHGTIAPPRAKDCFLEIGLPTATTIQYRDREG